MLLILAFAFDAAAGYADRCRILLISSLHYSAAAIDYCCHAIDIDYDADYQLAAVVFAFHYFFRFSPPWVCHYDARHYFLSLLAAAISSIRLLSFFALYFAMLFFMLIFIYDTLILLCWCRWFHSPWYYWLLSSLAISFLRLFSPCRFHFHFRCCYAADATLPRHFRHYASFSLFSPFSPLPPIIYRLFHFLFAGWCFIAEAAIISTFSDIISLLMIISMLSLMIRHFAFFHYFQLSLPPPLAVATALRCCHATLIFTSIFAAFFLAATWWYFIDAFSLFACFSYAMPFSLWLYYYWLLLSMISSFIIDYDADISPCHYWCFRFIFLLMSLFSPHWCHFDAIDDVDISPFAMMSRFWFSP